MLNPKEVENLRTIIYELSALKLDLKITRALLKSAVIKDALEEIYQLYVENKLSKEEQQHVKKVMGEYLKKLNKDSSSNLIIIICAILISIIIISLSVIYIAPVVILSYSILLSIIALIYCTLCNENLNNRSVINEKAVLALFKIRLNELKNDLIDKYATGLANDFAAEENRTNEADLGYELRHPAKRKVSFAPRLCHFFQATDEVTMMDGTDNKEKENHRWKNIII